MEINGLILLQSYSFVVMAGYSSTAVYKEWKLSKSQEVYVIFAKNDQDSDLVSDRVWSARLWKLAAVLVSVCLKEWKL
ncbi:hypothetical protein Bca4012_035324 [Brassica carinata]